MKPRDYLLAASWVAGIAVLGVFSQIWPLLLLVLIGLGVFAWQRRRLKCALACLALFLLGLGWSQLRAPRPGAADPARMAPLEHIELHGDVASDWIEQGPQRWSFDLSARELSYHGQPLRLTGKLRVSLKLRPGELSALPRIGDRLRLSGRLALPQPALNFGSFSYQDYLRQQGIFALAYAYGIEKTADGAWWLPARLLQDLRRTVLSGFEKRLPLGQARLLGSLLVGAGASPVPDEIQHTFQAAGLQHVLAVSGFQVELVVLGMTALCQLVGLGRKSTFGAGLTALWLFAALTGFPGSVLRAAVVASLGLVGYLKFRDIDALAGLVLGCCGLLLIEPWLLSDIGFQFSVLATAGLIVLAPWLEARMDWLPLPISRACAPMLAAQLFVLPAQLWHFGTLSWLFLPANLLAGLLTTALSWLAIAGALCAWLPPIQSLVLLPAGWLISGFLAGLALLLKLPSPVLYLPTLATSAMLLAYACLLLLKRLEDRLCRQMLIACLLAAPLLSGFVWLGDRHHCPVSVTFLSVGQGDAALIQTPQQVILIDAGPGWEGDSGWQDAGQREILPYLQKHGIRRIDTAILSHPHLDHFGGYQSLISALPIGRFITVRGASDSPAYLTLLLAIQKRGIPFTYAQNGMLEELAPSLKLVFWQPLPVSSASINDQSLAVELIHDRVRFLFSGDLEAEGENALLTAPGFEAAHTILKVPHHGSHTSSTSEFLQAVHPAEAIVSVGDRNKYHHPAPDVMDRYRELGIRTWRTDQNGAVCVCSQGKSYEIRAAASFVPSAQSESPGWNRETK